MMFAKIENGVVVSYPYNIGMVRSDYPGTSFPSDLESCDLSEFGVFPVDETSKPSAASGDIAVEDTPVLVSGVWTQQWVVRAMTNEERKALVPSVVSPRQIRKALRLAGIRPAVDAYLANADEETVEDWEYAVFIGRDNALMNTAAAALGMTEQQLDDLFILADGL